MEKNQQAKLTERYLAAAESFISKVKDDPNVIAVIVCGSLAYDQVWERSDIDMTVIVRDQVLKNTSYCIVEDDILINVSLATRSGNKRYMESQIGGSFVQAYLAKGKILYTTDESLYDYFEEYRQIGSDDIARSVFYMACELVYLYDKSRKWLNVKKDPEYAQYYLLKAAEVISRIEVCIQGEPPTREVIQKALTINPELIKPYYDEAMSHLYSEEEIQRGIDGLDSYLKSKLDIIMQPVIEFMKDQEIKTVTLIAKYFRTEGHFIIEIMDYLAEQGLIAKVSQTIRITPKSKRAVEEVGYLYVPYLMK